MKFVIAGVLCTTRTTALQPTFITYINVISSLPIKKGKPVCFALSHFSSTAFCQVLVTVESCLGLQWGKRRNGGGGSGAETDGCPSASARARAPPNTHTHTHTHHNTHHNTHNNTYTHPHTYTPQCARAHAHTHTRTHARTHTRTGDGKKKKHEKGERNEKDTHTNLSLIHISEPTRR